MVAGLTRHCSFCEHALVGTSLITIKDLSTDDRFRDHPLVLGPPYLRSYIGAPMVHQGCIISALMVLDVVPLEQPVAPTCTTARSLSLQTSVWLPSMSSLQKQTQTQIQKVH